MARATRTPRIAGTVSTSIATKADLRQRVDGGELTQQPGESRTGQQGSAIHDGAGSSVRSVLAQPPNEPQRDRKDDEAVRERV